VGAVGAEAGNGLWLSLLIAAALAVVIGLCYAELASMFPRAGADYEYTREALGERPAFVVGWLIVIGNIIAAAAVALGFGGYLTNFIDIDPAVAAIVMLALASLIAFAGIQETFWVTIIGTLIEVGGLLLIVAVGVPSLPDLELLPVSNGAAGVLGGAALVMFAFLGFSQIATLAEEAEDASRVLPLAILLSIGITALLYMAVGLAALAVLGDDLASSEAPLSDVAAKALGEGAGDFLALIALFSTANTMLLVMVAASRLIYGMAKQAALPRFLAWVHPGQQTPLRAIVLACLLSSVFAASGDLSFVAGATNFATFVGFGAICLSMIILRLRRPEAPRPFRVPLSAGNMPMAPLAGLALTLLLMLNLGLDVLALGAGLFLSGVIGMQALSLWKPAPAGRTD